MKQVYLDNAATTKIRQEVVDVMTTCLVQNYGNASSTHRFGRSSKTLIESARKKIATCLNASASEIIYTSGGTEANNLVLISAVRDLGVKRIITTKIEHHAVLNTVLHLNETHDVEVVYLDIDKQGDINLSQLEVLLQTKVKTLVSLMHINNEIGNVLDLKAVANMCQLNNTLFHSDTVQSIGHYAIDLQDTPIDFLVASAHKFHGPKGVGFLFVRKNIGLNPLIHGGEQERGLRAGTESLHNIIGMQEALSLSYNKLIAEEEYIKTLKTYFISKLEQAIPGATFNGKSGFLEQSAYTIINVCLPFKTDASGMLLFQLDLKGIACSRGSACQSGSSKKSHVLLEFLDKQDLEKPSLRFSLSIFNTIDDIDYTVQVLKNMF